MNVLSLFDGMSCGQQALERAGIKVDNYFASEIDKYAITVAMANYPNTKQLGSVVDLNGFDLPKIDLLIGGSPCQSFSFAGKRKGMSTKDEQEILTLEHYLQLKGEGFEFEGQSYLFWEFMRLLNETKPKYFLLENVKMSKKWKDILSKAIGVEPILINSNLVSAQNRQRLYWTNIPNIQQPEDKGVLIKDIVEQEVDEKYFLSEKRMAWLNNRIEIKYKPTPRVPSFVEKSNCLKIGGQGVDDLIVHNMMPRSSKNGNGGSGHLCRTDGKTYCLDTGNTNSLQIKDKVRRLTPIECERLQTVKDNYTNFVSDSQRYKMLGNGWTVDVIAHIFKFI